MRIQSHMPRHLFIALLLCLFGVAAGAQSLDFSDDFEDGEGPGWIHYDPLNGLGAGGVGSWNYNEGTCRMQATGALAPGSTGPARLGLYRTNLFSDFRVSADFVAWDSSLNQLFGLLGRVSQPGLGTTVGYAFAYDSRPGLTPPGRFYIYRLVGEAGTTVVTVNYTLPPGAQYRFVFTGTAEKLQGQVFTLSNSVPVLPAVLTLNGNDVAYTNGFAGVFGYDNSSAENNTVDFTIDNFSASRLRPALTIERATDGTTVVKWPRWATAYQLQSTDDLRNTSWDDVTWSLSQDADHFIYSEISDATLFFRLIAR